MEVPEGSDLEDRERALGGSVCVGGAQAALPGPFSAIPFSLCKVYSVGLGVPSLCNPGLSSLTGQSDHAGVLCGDFAPLEKGARVQT